MRELTYSKLHAYTLNNIKRVLGVTEALKKSESMSIEFPGYGRMKAGEHDTGEFVTLFLDMRGSTDRAKEIGPHATMVTMHALLPSLARVVVDLGGFVVDYPGDGIMAHWKRGDGESLGVTVDNAVTAGCWMLDAVDRIINPLLQDYNIKPMKCGVGIDGGEVLVTKVGIPGSLSAKAIGDSVNRASKLCARDVNAGIVLCDADLAASAYYLAPIGVRVWDPLFTYRRIEPSAVVITPTEAMRLPRPEVSDVLLEAKALKLIA